jgi:hypothetical protein
LLLLMVVYSLMLGCPLISAPWTNLQCVTAISKMIGCGSSVQAEVSLLLSFYLHYFSAPSEHFLPKELSQIFAPIPGGPHATSRAALFMPMVPMWRSMTAPSRATALQM